MWDRSVLAWRRLGDLHEELDVGPSLLEPVEKQVDCLLGLQRMQDPAQLDDHRQLVRRPQDLLLAGGGLIHVEGRDPAIDVDQSSTRKEEILLSPDELAVVIKLRRVLHALEPQQAIDLLLDRLKKTRTNVEFLMQIAKTTPGQD